MNTRGVLLVEDDPSDEALTLRAFRQAKITNDVMVVRDGAEALDYLFATGAYATRDPLDLPSLVLLDIKLPKVDGLEVLKRIRTHAKTRLLPVVLFTSSREHRDLVTGYGEGANGYVCKPVEFNEFADAVQQLGLYWLNVNEAPPPDTSDGASGT